MCALDAGKIYSFMLNNLLFEESVWLVGKLQRKTHRGAADPDPQSNESSLQRERERAREDVSVCAQEEEAARGRRNTEINIQRKRGKEQPPSFLGCLGCRPTGS